ncbi:serine/threonine protein kinase [Raineyella antarctica]|uniref:non-specific serine/threonine protein kinase n=1 Tax=Raineyella antarctica TaxID=1577474 RepID=A0A1G6GXC2_9ACTN|nr:serine/threonine-protein kinase [Raineyella antarctica]SDB86325.1 serine/threonine protein kinase [Raineyella antarctica]
MQPGTVLAARYRLERAIGAGGMGQVWAARDEVLGREVAVKVVDGGVGDDLERFRREARTAAGLGHPNLVTIYDAGIDGGTAYLVMELLPGPNLEAYVAARGVLPESEAVALAEQIAAGLAAAHAAGVVHRDIKPANVVFQGPGTVKIVDFGIARLAQSSAARLTATNTLVGSAPYLSPEQVEGRPGDERSDIYALGCVLTTMLTGRPPFQGDHPLAVLHQHMSSVAPPIRARNPGVSVSLDQLVGEMLQKSPDERPATCQQVIARLQEVGTVGASAAGDTVAATRVMPPSAAGGTRMMSPPTLPLAAGSGVAGSAGSAPGRKSPIRAAVVAAGAVLLVAVVVAAVLLGRQGGRSQGPQSATSATSSATVAGVRTNSTPSPAPSTGAGTPTTRRSATAPSTPSLPQALAGLHDAVNAEVVRGVLDPKKAEELTKRVDQLDKQLSADGGKDADKQVKEMQKYLGELTSKGELSTQGSRQITTALAQVRAAL